MPRLNLPVASAIWVLGVLSLGMIVGYLFGPAQDPGWYDGLAKAPLNPPPIAFPIAWTALYILMALAAARVWMAPPSEPRTKALRLFLIQLALNLAWTPVFFGFQAILGALVLTVVLLGVAMAATFAMGKIDRTSGGMMAPYLAWLCFALYLTAWIASANPAQL